MSEIRHDDAPFLVEMRVTLGPASSKPGSAKPDRFPPIDFFSGTQVDALKSRLASSGLFIVTKVKKLGRADPAAEQAGQRKTCATR
jgi:hypothetical protein